MNLRVLLGVELQGARGFFLASLLDFGFGPVFRRFARFRCARSLDSGLCSSANAISRSPCRPNGIRCGRRGGDRFLFALLSSNNEKVSVSVS